MISIPQKLPLKEAIQKAHQLCESGQMDACRQLCKQIQQVSPNRPRILHLLALLDHYEGKHELALENIQTAIQISSEILEFHNTSGLIYMALGKPVEANRSFVRAYELLKDKRTHPELGKIYSNIANSLNVQGKYEEAIAFHKHALSINEQDPFALWNLANIYLLHGQFEQGWKGYEYRFLIRPRNKQGESVNHNIPKWNGKFLGGKRLLIHDEQGFGDTIQFSRYLPKIAEFDGEVVFETRLPLAGLFKDIPGVSKVCLKRDLIYKQMNFDYHIHLCSLPGIFSTTLKNIPDKTDFLYINPERIAFWAQKIPTGKFRVGLVWTGNLRNIMLRHRSCNLKELEPMLTVSGVTFVGLQKGEKLGDVNELPTSIKFTNLGDQFDDFSDTAAVISQLDLIITIDTAVAHLAATMGKPVWLLLSYPPDFRWLLEREDSPWYPDMRIFRQTEHGKWGPVIKRITEALRNLD